MSEPIYHDAQSRGEMQARLALDTHYEAMEYDVDEYLDVRDAYRLAVRAELLADIVGAVDGMQTYRIGDTGPLVDRDTLLTYLHGHAARSGATP